MPLPMPTVLITTMPLTPLKNPTATAPTTPRNPAAAAPGAASLSAANTTARAPAFGRGPFVPTVAPTTSTASMGVDTGTVETAPSAAVPDSIMVPLPPFQPKETPRPRQRQQSHLLHLLCLFPLKSIPNHLPPYHRYRMHPSRSS